jgi:hypothetical protein
VYTTLIKYTKEGKLQYSEQEKIFIEQIFDKGKVSKTYEEPQQFTNKDSKHPIKNGQNI